MALIYKFQEGNKLKLQSDNTSVVNKKFPKSLAEAKLEGKKSIEAEARIQAEQLVARKNAEAKEAKYQKDLKEGNVPWYQKKVSVVNNTPEEKIGIHGELAKLQTIKNQRTTQEKLDDAALEVMTSIIPELPLLKYVKPAAKVVEKEIEKKVVNKLLYKPTINSSLDNTVVFNLARANKKKPNIIKKQTQEGNFIINSRETPTKGLVNVHVKSPTGEIQATRNVDGTYGLSFEDANAFNPGKSMLKLKDQLAGKVIHETKSFSTDSYKNVLKLKSKLPHEPAGFAPLNASNKTNNFLDDLIIKDNSEWSASAAFKSESAAQEGAKRMDEYMAKLGETGKSKVINNNGKFEVHIPNYKINVPNKFKSEIDWGKWNKEIPENSQLMKEYHTIESTSKANGSWMKNPDGSKFEGTPEQFVQQNSENFKKAFPEGHNEVWRGANNDEMIDKDNMSVFTANKDLAKHYTGADIDKFYNPNIENAVLPGRNLFNLAHKKSKNSFELNFNNDSWSNLPLNSNKERVAKKYEDAKQYIKDLRESKAMDTEVYDLVKNHANKTVNKMRSEIFRLKNLKDNSSETTNMLRTKLGKSTSTDNIAKYLEDHNIDNALLRKVNDSGLGDVTIVNHKKGNYLKSLIGNNGMFDMTNPNIYKALIPAIAGAAAVQQKKKGGLIYKTY